MGFSKDQVEWVVAPFNQTYKPGDKDYDFAIEQISYSAKRDEAVDFSESYYDVQQALVAVKGSPIAGATSISDLAGYTIAAPIGTTSYDYIVANIPDATAGSYDDAGRHRRRPQRGADRRDRRRRAHRLLPRRPLRPGGEGRRRRGAVPARRRAGVLRAHVRRRAARWSSARTSPSRRSRRTGPSTRSTRSGSSRRPTSARSPSSRRSRGPTWGWEAAGPRSSSGTSQVIRGCPRRSGRRGSWDRSRPRARGAWRSRSSAPSSSSP